MRRAMVFAAVLGLLVAQPGVLGTRAGLFAVQDWATAEPAGGTPATLTYVESSAGLIPPALESGHTELEMGDVNGDGYLDLVSIGDHGSPYVGTQEHGVMVWFGDGTGSWSVYQSGEFGYGGVALGDVNNDSQVDVAYGMHHNYSGVDFGDQLLEIALGDGTGRNWTPWDDGLATNGEYWGMFSTDLVDVDNDGDLDVASISFGCCNGVHVYLNQGNGAWVQSFAFTGVNGNNDMTTGDVNGDGNADLAVTLEDVAIFLGDGSGGFASGQGNLPSPGSYGFNDVALGDVNGDGQDELGFAASDGGLEVWTWTGSGTWQSLSGSLPPSGPYEGIQLFDMNMDGYLDVAAFGTGQVRIWAGNGAGGWSEIAAFTLPAPGYREAFRVGGDADHNGYPDMALVDDEGTWPNDQNHLRFFRETSTPTALEIKPVFPHGAETFNADGIVFVDWLSGVPSGAVGSVSLELSIHGPGGPWLAVATGLVDGGRYQWRIPPETPTTHEAVLRYTLDVSSEITSALTLQPFTILGMVEEPIEGLAAISDGPTALGEPTLLTATVESGTAVLYQWTLGDGSHAEGATVTHTYPATGTFTALVTASNSLSLLTATVPIVVYVEPVSGLTVHSDSPTALGEPTVLTATVESGTSVEYEWALGDGSHAEGAAVTHTYPTTGTFTALVTASNSLSLLTATVPVVIDEAIAGLDATNDGPTPLGHATTLTATISAGSNVTFTWVWGDGKEGFARAYVSPEVQGDGAIRYEGSDVVTHTYVVPGLYVAVVAAENAVSRVTATTTVTVVEARRLAYLPMVVKSDP